MKFKLNCNNQTRTFDKKQELYGLIKDDKHEYICAKVNNSVRELSYFVNEDAKIEFLTLKDQDAIGLYRRSLCYIIAMAFYRLYPEIRLRFSFSISRAMYFEAIGYKEIPIEMLNKVENEMKNIIKHNYRFIRHKESNKKVKELYKKVKLLDKIEIMTYRPEKTAHYYECDGYYNYFYGRMVYSTGYIKDYNFIKSNHGVLVQYPRAEYNGKIPPFENAPAYMKALKSSQNWAEEMECATISNINKKMTKENRTIDFINECEARHSRLLCELGDVLEKQNDKIKLVCIAGPSSSGKTTFANRLRVELLSRGIHPTMISLDNYYLPRNKMPLNEKGEYDFECLEALDIALFNKQMFELVSGKEIDAPIYHFGGKPNTYKKISLTGNKDVVIIEGIHALNETITSKINRENKYKIYISPQIQINIDNDNPLNLTDLRLLRRITRDYKFRHTKAVETINMWNDVRKGEFKYIYKGIEEADFVFNSFSFYELCAFRKYTMPLLHEIKQDSPLFSTAERLLRLLKFFKPMKTKWIPCNSLIREFIGGSCFE